MENKITAPDDGGFVIVEANNIEESIDKTNKVIFETNAQCCDIMNNLIKEETIEKELIKQCKELL